MVKEDTAVTTLKQVVHCASPVVVQDIWRRDASLRSSKEKHLQSRGMEQVRQESSFSVVSAAGRLRSALPFWRDILKADKYILSVLDHGYFIPFVAMPGAFRARNNLSARKEPVFVRQAIADLLLKGYAVRVKGRPFCTNPLTVAHGHKLRLVLDLRHVNQFVQYTKFVYEDWNLLSQVLQKDDFLISFDYVAGYHHNSIAAEHQQFLGFAFRDEDGTKKFYHFTHLPFGLSSASHIFTMLNKPIIRHWRGKSFPLFHLH